MWLASKKKVMDFDSDSEEPELSDDEVLGSGALPTFIEGKDGTFPTKFEHLPELERQFARSFVKEIYTVSRNLQESLEAERLNPGNLFHVVYFCLREPLQLIVRNGTKVFRKKCGQELTLQVAFSCLIFKAYIGAYKTSPRAYFEDLENGSSQYKHHVFFPSVQVLKAFDAVLESDEVDKHVVGEWKRPGFRAPPTLFHKISSLQSVFCLLLAQDKIIQVIWSSEAISKRLRSPLEKIEEGV